MTRFNRFLMLSAMLGACTPAPMSQVDDSQAALAVTGDYNDRLMNWGTGFDSLTGATAGTVCVDLSEVPGPAPVIASGGQSTELRMEVLENKQQLEERLAVAVSGKVSAAMG